MKTLDCQYEANHPPFFPFSLFPFFLALKLGP